MTSIPSICLNSTSFVMCKHLWKDGRADLATTVLSFACDFALVPANSFEPTLPHRDALLHAVVVPYRGEWKRFAFLQKSQSSRIITLSLGLSNRLYRIEICFQQRFSGISHADHPRHNTIDRSIEIIQPDMDATLKAIVNYLVHDVLKFIVPHHDVITVPAYASADVKQRLVHKEHNRTELCRYALSGME